MSYLTVKDIGPVQIVSQVTPPPPMLTFYTSDGNAGTLKTGENGKLTFEGDVEQSAQVFFDAIILRNSNFIQSLTAENEAQQQRIEELEKVLRVVKDVISKDGDFDYSDLPQEQRGVTEKLTLALLVQAISEALTDTTKADEVKNEKQNQ